MCNSRKVSLSVVSGPVINMLTTSLINIKRLEVQSAHQYQVNYQCCIQLEITLN